MISVHNEQNSDIPVYNGSIMVYIIMVINHFGDHVMLYHYNNYCEFIPAQFRGECRLQLLASFCRYTSHI